MTTYLPTHLTVLRKVDGFIQVPVYDRNNAWWGRDLPPSKKTGKVAIRPFAMSERLKTHGNSSAD